MVAGSSRLPLVLGIYADHSFPGKPGHLFKKTTYPPVIFRGYDRAVMPFLLHDTGVLPVLRSPFFTVDHLLLAFGILPR